MAKLQSASFISTESRKNMCEYLQSRPWWRRYATYLQCYFVSIASILGTGVLGLPVTLSQCGMLPFLMSFVGGFFVQVLVIYYMTEILQKSYVQELSENLHRNKRSITNTSRNNPGSETDDDDDANSVTSSVLAGHVILPKPNYMQNITLHLIGQQFLNSWMSKIFDFTVLTQFLAFLISYSLAGGDTMEQMLRTPKQVILPLYVWSMAFLIIFALDYIQPLISVLTFIKGTFIIVTVGVVIYVGLAIHTSPSNDFRYVAEPFLMGTVALGGTANIMPLMFNRIHVVSNEVKGFRNAVVLALTSGCIVCIVWCWAVLSIVPQSSNSCFLYEHRERNKLYISGVSAAETRAVCALNLSLEYSAKIGQVSTLPLTEIISNLYPHYRWLASLINLFIATSVTVIFLTMAAAFTHTLNGLIDSIRSKQQVEKESDGWSKLSSFSSPKIWSCKVVTAVLAFLVVYLVALVNPDGFQEVLEKAASLVLNIEAAVFIFLMIRTVSSGVNRFIIVPHPLPEWLYKFNMILPVYFGFAILFDVSTFFFQQYQRTLLPWSFEIMEREGVIIPAAKAVYPQEETDYTFGSYDISFEDDNASKQQRDIILM